MRYKINNIVFDTQTHTLTKGDKQLLLEAKSFQLLISFIENNGKVLSRDELIALAWQGQVVSDGAVNKAISKLRNHFEQLSPGKLFIDTKTKFGYQFCADVVAINVQEAIHNNPHTTKSPIISAYILLGCSLLVALSVLLVTQDSAPPSEAPTLKSTQLIRFSAHDGVETKLSNSARGDILYQSFNSENTRHLHLKRTSGTISKIPLEAHELSSVSLSPSGKFIAYTKVRNGQCYVMTATTSLIEKTAHFNCDRFSDLKLVWGHNEQSLFMQARENNATPYSIYQLSLATKSLQQVTLPVGLNHLRGDYLLTHHSQRPLIAFARYLESDRSEIHVINSTNLKTQYVYTLDHKVDAITWGLTQTDLYIANQKKLLKLVKNDSEILIKQFSYPIESLASTIIDNKNAVVATQYQPSSKILSYDIHTKSTEIIYKSAALNRLPRELSAGHFLFISDMAQIHTLWHLADDHLTQLELPFEFGFRRYAADKNNNFILFEKHGALYEFDLSSQALNLLFGKQHKAYVANYHSAQSKIIYSSNKSGQWQLWLFDKSNKSHLQLTQFGGYSGYDYKNGLIYSKRNQDGLWMKSSHNQEVKLISGFKNINWLNWRLIKDHVYFYRPESGIWQYDINTKSEKLIMQRSERFIHQYTISTDGEKVIFVELQPLQGDIQALIFE
jgi:DNA-binding winged helix-turn-helix (wHTH) protein/Tol biopolymer transport system component